MCDQVILNDAVRNAVNSRIRDLRIVIQCRYGEAEELQAVGDKHTKYPQVRASCYEAADLVISQAQQLEQEMQQLMEAVGQGESHV